MAALTLTCLEGYVFFYILLKNVADFEWNTMHILTTAGKHRELGRLTVIWWTSDLSRLYSAFDLLGAGIDSSSKLQNKQADINKWAKLKEYAI